MNNKHCFPIRERGSFRLIRLADARQTVDRRFRAMRPRATWSLNPESGRPEMHWQSDNTEEHSCRLMVAGRLPGRGAKDPQSRHHVRRGVGKYTQVLCIGAVATWVSACHSGVGAESPTPGPTHVRDQDGVAVPERSELRHYLVLGNSVRQQVQAPLLAPAVVEADPSRVANVLPPLSGRISALYVHLGDTVRAGQPLFTIDSADLAQARADLEKAQAALTLSQKALSRTRDLRQHGIAAQKDEEQAESDYASAKSEYDRATAVFAVFGIPLQANESPRRLTVKSPVSGRISMLNAVPGTFANDNTAALMTVSDTSTIWFTAGIQEKDLSAVKVGEEVAATTQSYPGELFKGRVAFVSDQLDTDTRTIKVRIAYPNSEGRLRPGMFANVTFLGTAHEAVLVPTTALIQDDARTEVFVEIAPWKFQARSVTVGTRVGDQTEILSGLKAGDRIVAKQGVLLND